MILVHIRLWPIEKSKKFGYNSGQVQVFFKDRWGPICRDTWSWNEANVVCKSMFNETAATDFEQDTNRNGRSSGGAIIRDLNCQGSENSLMDCQFKTYLDPGPRCRSPIWSSLVCKPSKKKI